MTYKWRSKSIAAITTPQAYAFIDRDAACAYVDERRKPTINQWPSLVCLKEHYTLRDFRGVFLPGEAVTLVHHNYFSTQSMIAPFFQASPVIADRTVILILAALDPIRRLTEILSCYHMPTENDGQNAAAKIFRDNADVNRMQYEVTCRLEEYAKEEFGINIRFTSFKWE